MADASDVPRFHSVGHGGIWLALDGRAPGVAEALDAAGLPTEVRERLLHPAHSVRRKELGAGTFIGLARYAVEPSEDDDHTVGAALWLEPQRLVSIDQGAIPRTTREAGRREKEPGGEGGEGSAEPARSEGPWGLLAAHLAEMAEDLEDDLHALSPILDELEDRIAEHAGDMPLRELSALRQRLIHVRRHAVPFGLLTRGLASDRRLVSEPEAQSALRDVADSVERSQAALGLHFERSQILNDQIQAELADRMNRATYRLGIVATVFLPLGFLTGLLGINVAGIPGDHDPYAFWLVCGFLLVIAVVWYAAITRSGKL